MAGEYPKESSTTERAVDKAFWLFFSIGDRVFETGSQFYDGTQSMLSGMLHNPRLAREVAKVRARLARQQLLLEARSNVSALYDPATAAQLVHDVAVQDQIIDPTYPEDYVGSASGVLIDLGLSSQQAMNSILAAKQLAVDSAANIYQLPQQPAT